MSLVRESDPDDDLEGVTPEAVGLGAARFVSRPWLIAAERRRRAIDAERALLARDADEIRGRCKRLVGYIREAWPVIEPTTPYVYGWHHDAISEHLEAVTRGEIQRLQINEPPGCMKLCADSTPIITPTGMRTHGDLQPGDEVYGPDGVPTRVVRVSRKAPADRQVTFSTGESIRCNGDHLWTVYDQWDHCWKTMQTRELTVLGDESDRYVVPDAWCEDRKNRTITDVQWGEFEQGQCIMVERPDGLYVVGRTNVVTHNSLIASVLWETWEWGPAGLPGLRYLTTSYKEAYARRDSRKHRDLVQSEWFRVLWPDVVLERDNEVDFENTFKGARRAVPFRSLTAGRGNRLVIDDPHSTEQVESKTELARARRIFRESATSRLNDPKRDAIIVIMHRLHNQDVCAVIEELGLPYVKLVLPMEYDPKVIVPSKFYKDPRTTNGQLLFPEFIPRETVEKNKIELGAHAYQTQYQQQASAREGGIFKRQWFKIVDAVPARIRARVRRWDLAASEDSGSWTSGVRMVSTAEDEYYIEDIQRLREVGAAVHKTIKVTADADPNGTWLGLPQDPGQAGKDQVASYQKENAGHRIWIDRETGSKITRAEPFAAQCEAGNVYLVRGQWNEAFIEELCKISHLTIKVIESDQMDAAAGAFNKLITLKGFQVTPEMLADAQRVAQQDQIRRGMTRR
jgi:predicted phage terminase large subunit-like protein